MPPPPSSSLLSYRPTTRQVKIARRVLLALALYFVAFVMFFDVMGPPCRTTTDWLGPKLRYERAYVDAGKVLIYDHTPGRAYDLFYPLCRTWLFFNGLPE